MKKILYLCVCLLTISCAFAQKNFPEPFIITNDLDANHNLPVKNCQYLVTKDSVSFKVASGAESNSKFKTGVEKTADVGDKANIWIRYKLKNSLKFPKKIVLSLITGRCDMYVTNGNTTKHFVTGYYVPWSQKDGIKRLLQIPVILPAEGEITVYNHYITKSGLINTPTPIIGDYEKVVEKELTKKVSYDEDMLLEAALFGFILFAALFNFFFVIITRERVYVLYFITLLICALSYGTDIIASMLLNENPKAVSSFNGMVSLILLFMVLQTFRAFIQLKKTFPRWDKFLLWYPIFLLATSTISLIRGSLLVQDVAEIISIGSILLFLIGNIIVLFKLLLRRDKQARIFIMAGIPFLVCFLLSIFNNLDYLRIIGGLWAIIILSWAMFARFRLLMQENANQALLREEERNRLTEQQNEILELQVAERTAELQSSIESLKQTQTQLIQSEKMASLGELTAGIAHEIQNPLNFVNNFSDVSIELLDEMQEEMAKGDTEEAAAIAGDIKLNLEKIAHHGRRADGIVKGMLQHSRASSGQKEPTDINVLADEYLRLAYHGLRAKDKSFNADLATNFDESLPKINIVPQDIGRVLLNLFTNAFYATQAKSKQWSVSSDQSQFAGESYKPIVSVSTHQKGDTVEIIVKDNGTGIPDAIKDKILQPFFTTKPTGEGTGLGLSLSYDIVVKSHNGSIEIISNEGIGSEFIIKIPV